MQQAARKITSPPWCRVELNKLGVHVLVDLHNGSLCVCVCTQPHTLSLDSQISQIHAIYLHDGRLHPTRLVHVFPPPPQTTHLTAPSPTNHTSNCMTAAGTLPD